MGLHIRKLKCRKLTKGEIESREEQLGSHAVIQVNSKDVDVELTGFVN